MEGLLDYLQDGKLGYVALYNPQQVGKGSDVMKILKDLKGRKYESRFDHFIIEDGWSKTGRKSKANGCRLFAKYKRTLQQMKIKRQNT